MTPKDLAIRYLTDALNKIKSDSSEINEEQMIDIAKTIAHVPMSKAQAASYLNLSTSRFSDYVRMKQIPKGKKRVGWKELAWYQDELDECKYKKNSK